MSVSKHNSKKFQDLYRKYYGKELSDDQSGQMFEALVEMFLMPDPCAKHQDAQKNQVISALSDKGAGAPSCPQAHEGAKRPEIFGA